MLLADEIFQQTTNDKKPTIFCQKLEKVNVKKASILKKH